MKKYFFTLYSIIAVFIILVILDFSVISYISDTTAVSEFEDNVELMEDISKNLLGTNQSSLITAFSNIPEKFSEKGFDYYMLTLSDDPSNMAVLASAKDDILVSFAFILLYENESIDNFKEAKKFLYGHNFEYSIEDGKMKSITITFKKNPWGIINSTITQDIQNIINYIDNDYNELLKHFENPYEIHNYSNSLFKTHLYKYKDSNIAFSVTKNGAVLALVYEQSLSGVDYSVFNKKAREIEKYMHKYEYEKTDKKGHLYFDYSYNKTIFYRLDNKNRKIYLGYGIK